MTEPTEALLPETEQFLRSLPGLAYPQQLVNLFPRIANRVAALRQQPDELRVYFDHLENDHRGGRKGFPFDVMLEIMALREQLLPPTPPTASEEDETRWVS